MGLGGHPRTQANETTFETSRPASCCRQRGPHPAVCTVPVLVSSLWASRPDDACQRGTGRQIVSRTTRAASADSEVRPGPRPDPTPASPPNRRSRAGALSTSSLPTMRPFTGCYVRCTQAADYLLGAAGFRRCECGRCRGGPGAGLAGRRVCPGPVWRRLVVIHSGGGTGVRFTD